jgi:hypothetical protein
LPPSLHRPDVDAKKLSCSLLGKSLIKKQADDFTLTSWQLIDSFTEAGPVGEVAGFFLILAIH